MSYETYLESLFEGWLEAKLLEQELIDVIKQTTDSLYLNCSNNIH